MPRSRLRFLRATAFLLLTAAATVGFAKPKVTRTLGYSSVAEGYKREKAKGGGWEAETYVLGEGRFYDPTKSDESFDKVPFDKLVEFTALALARQDYLPVAEGQQPDLLIVLHWGKTVPFGEDAEAPFDMRLREAIEQVAGIEARDPLSDASRDATYLQRVLERERSDESKRWDSLRFNARVLGLTPALKDYWSVSRLPDISVPSRVQHLYEEIETPRYFMVLQAFDFESLGGKGDLELLWSARFSVRAEDRSFHEEVEGMLLSAVPLFGEDSKRVRFNLLPGKAKLGEIEVVGLGEEGETQAE